MQYLLLVIALAVSVVLAARYVPMRGDSLFPEAMQQQMDQLEQMQDFEDMETPTKVDPEKLPEDLTGEDGAGKTYYRWRGEDGSWHYGDRPPPGVEYEPVEPNPVTTRSAEQIRGKGNQSDGDDSE